MCLSMMMVMCSKQHLSNIVGEWIHVKAKQRSRGVEKKCWLYKKACYCNIDNDEASNFYVFTEIIDSNSSKQNFGKVSLMCS